jgi:hypothetical protein
VRQACGTSRLDREASASRGQRRFDATVGAPFELQIHHGATDAHAFDVQPLGSASVRRRS